MEYKLTKNDNSTIELDITYSSSEIDTAFDKAYVRANSKVKVNGFRQGKAPLEMVKKMLGESVMEDAITILITESLNDLVPKLDFNPYKQPKLEIVKYDRKEILNAKAIYELSPDVTLGAYKDVEFNSYTFKIEDEDIMDQLKYIQRQFQKTASREEGETSQDGDMLDIDIQTISNGEVVQSNTNQTYYIGMNPAQRAIDENLLGLKVGEEKTFDYTYPLDVGGGLSGKTFTFTIKINQISKIILPELDDNLAKEEGSFQTIEELKNEMKTNLLNNLSKEFDKKYYAEILQKIVKNSTYQIPLSLIEDEKTALFEQIKSKEKNPNLSFEKYAEMLELPKEELISNFENQAILNLKNFLTVHKIASVESLVISKEEIDAVYEASVASLKTKPSAELKNRFLLNIHDNLTNKKVMEFLLKSSKPKKQEEISVAKAEEVLNTSFEEK
jgi:trigger factor